MKDRVIGFTISDKNNLKYFKMFENSLRKFHDQKELPLVLIGPEDLKKRLTDKDFFYRATPVIAKEFIDKYDYVIKFDCDQIVTGNLSHLWEGEFDVAVVNNSNPREMKSYPVSVWNINPLAYVNCGLVVMRSEEFVKHWYDQCFQPHFFNYQFREQDLLNILVQYGNYNVRKLDEGNSYWGLASKQYWPEIQLKEDKLILYKSEEWPDKDKEIKILHWGGGNSPDKLNYNIRFKPDVIERLDFLTK